MGLCGRALENDESELTHPYCAGCDAGFMHSDYAAKFVAGSSAAEAADFGKPMPAPAGAFEQKLTVWLFLNHS